MISAYKVFVEKFEESSECDALSENMQPLRSHICRLRGDGEVNKPDDDRRRYNSTLTSPSEKGSARLQQAKVQWRNLTFTSRAHCYGASSCSAPESKHRSDAEETYRAIRCFSSKCGGCVQALVINQDSMFVSEKSTAKSLRQRCSRHS